MDYYSSFLTRVLSKRFTIVPNIHPFMHTFTHVVSATQGDSQLVKSSQGEVDRLLRDTSTLREPSGYQQNRSTS
jgi:hypothetical protein